MGENQEVKESACMPVNSMQVQKADNKIFITMPSALNLHIY
tara:strand:+ start:7996 stop:8118 length:123 start_codon:yes stop_codon:yes gene_type:complete